MSSKHRHRRTSNPAASFPSPLEPGELAVNTANRQLAVGDAASGTIGQAKDLLAIRIFDPTAQYAVNDLVARAGTIYRANVPISPGIFDGTKWTGIDAGTAASIPFTPHGNIAAVTVQAAIEELDTEKVAVAGDIMTGPLVLPATTPAADEAVRRDYVDAADVALADTINVALDGKVEEAPNDGKAYSRKMLGWSEVVQQVYGAAHNYSFHAGTVPPPAAGSVRFNNPTQTLATQIYINYTTNDSIAVNLKTYFLARVKVGDTFYFQDKDQSDKWRTYTMYEPLIDMGTYATLPVHFLAGGSIDLTAARIIVTREGPSVASPIGEAPNDGYPYARQSLGWSRTEAGSGGGGGEGPMGPAGPAGPAGAAGTPGEKWWTGAGDPSLVTLDGDLYLDTTDGQVWERIAGAWSLRCDITGPPGPEGLPARAGPDL